MLTAKQQKCIELMISADSTQKEIAETIKVSENTICNWKKNPEFVDAYEARLKSSIKEIASKAYRTQLKLLNARSEMVRYMVSKDILDRAGLKPTDKVEVNGQVNNPFAGLSTEDLKKMIGDE